MGIDSTSETPPQRFGVPDLMQALLDEPQPYGFQGVPGGEARVLWIYGLDRLSGDDATEDARHP